MIDPTRLHSLKRMDAARFERRCRLRSQNSGLDRAARIARAYHPFGHVARDHRTSPDDSPIADSDSRGDKTTRSHPAFGAYIDRLPDEGIGGIRVVMRARAKKRILRNDGHATD